MYDVRFTIVMLSGVEAWLTLDYAIKYELSDWQKAIIDERHRDLEQNMDAVTDVFETL